MGYFGPRRYMEKGFMSYFLAEAQYTAREDDAVKTE